MRPVVYAAGLGMSLIVLMLAGCGDDGRMCPGPVVWLEVVPRSAGLEIGEALTLKADICAVCATGIDWYVNGFIGGNHTLGTVTQSNPAVYTAPDVLPMDKRIRVTAVSREDPCVADTCVIRLKFTRIHVDAGSGHDVYGTGAVSKPLKTISVALEIVSPGMEISVANGTYDATNGETFPLIIPDDVSLVGDNPDSTAIVPAAGAPAGITLSGANCTLRRFTVRDTVGLDPVVLIGQVSSNAHLDSIHVFTGHLAILVDGAAGALIENSGIYGNTKCFCGFGIDFRSGDAGTVVRNCELLGFECGMRFYASSDAVVEGCEIGSSWTGIQICCLDDPENSPNPDFGGGARGSDGRNHFTAKMINQTPNTIYARFNMWYNYPPIEGEDYTNEGGGQIIW